MFNGLAALSLVLCTATVALWIDSLFTARQVRFICWNPNGDLKKSVLHL
jgi:hypothetical protein